jgi:hypothetical protein
MDMPMMPTEKSMGPLSTEKLTKLYVFVFGSKYFQKLSIKGYMSTKKYNVRLRVMSNGFG